MILALFGGPLDGLVTERSSHPADFAWILPSGRCHESQRPGSHLYRFASRSFDDGDVTTAYTYAEHTYRVCQGCTAFVLRTRDKTCALCGAQLVSVRA